MQVNRGMPRAIYLFAAVLTSRNLGKRLHAPSLARKCPPAPGSTMVAATGVGTRAESGDSRSRRSPHSDDGWRLAAAGQIQIRTEGQPTPTSARATAARATLGWGDLWIVQRIPARGQRWQVSRFRVSADVAGAGRRRYPPTQVGSRLEAWVHLRRVAVGGPSSCFDDLGGGALVSIYFQMPNSISPS
jgi:hypothetical protein